VRDVLTFGEALCVFHPASGERLVRGVAGAELNVACGLAKLGRTVTYVSRVGADPFGEAIRERLEAAGVEPLLGVDEARPTGLYFREVAASGPRRVYYYRAGSAASVLGPADLPPLDGFRLVHATGITAALSGSCRRTVEAASLASTFTLDVNFRPALADAARWRRLLEPVLGRAEVVFVSEDDAAAIDPAAALGAGARAVVELLGARGARYRGADGAVVEAAAPPVDAVDTVGAGDAFVAGFLDARLHGASPGDALAAGCAVAARVVAVAGDQAPW
jgi:2-dehydro-3-deoxygluconokinase